MSSTARCSRTGPPGSTTSHSTKAPLDIEASTACYASTSPRAPTCRGGVPRSSTPSPPHSTTGPARHSAGRHPPKPSTSSYPPYQQSVLPRPIESAEYTSSEFRAVLTELGLRQSMGRTGSCYDNAACESLWAVLKEELGTRTWPSRASARTEVFEFIEAFYNRRRLRRHPELGYLTPIETRKRLQQQHTLAA
jgi:Integrase core domain